MGDRSSALGPLFFVADCFSPAERNYKVGGSCMHKADTKKLTSSDSKLQSTASCPYLRPWKLPKKTHSLGHLLEEVYQGARRQEKPAVLHRTIWGILPLSGEWEQPHQSWRRNTTGRVYGRRTQPITVMHTDRRSWLYSKSSNELKHIFCKFSQTE